MTAFLNNTAGNSGFCNIGAGAIPISIGSLLGCGSGRSFSIWLFVLIFIFSISIGQRFRAEDFQIPQHRKALSLCAMLKNPKLILFLFFCSSLFGSCRDNWVDTSQYDQTDGKFVKEIPIATVGRDKGQPVLFYRLTKLTTHALQLDSLETGFETLQIRVWLGHSMAIKRHVVILKLIDKKWTGQLITFDHHLQKADINVKNISPNNGWENLIASLKKLDIINLPNADDLPDYNGCGQDGITYYVEVATRHKYRFFYYCNPIDNSDKFWQAKNLLTFSKILEDEFDFEYTK
jgi:hypothetical protein